MRKRYVAPLLACLTLVVPAGASAHAKTATVALDYRLVLDRTTRDLSGVHVAILDGDRSLRISAGRQPVLVLGDLGERMLRIDRTGAWANRASVTAVAARLVTQGRGWKRVGGSTYTWHDHRLAPPPYADGRPGPVARFRVPIVVGARHAAIAGSFVRYARPSPFPWLGLTVVVIGAAVAVARLAHARAWFTIALGTSAGLAAIASLASFGAADSPNGRVAWVELGLAAFVATAAAIGLVRLRGEQRLLLATLIGAAAATTTLGSLGVFWHAVVISAFPPFLARAICAVALAAGIAAAATGLMASRRPA